MKNLLNDEAYGFIKAEDKDLIVAFDAEMNRLGYTCNKSIGDDPGSPSVDEVTVIGRFLSNNFFEFLPLIFAEFSWTTRLGFSSQSMQTVFCDFFSPTSNGGERGLGNFGNFVVVETTLNEIPRRQTASGLLR